MSLVSSLLMDDKIHVHYLQMPNGMEKYKKHHLMGPLSQVLMKQGCTSSRFVCQPNSKKRVSDSTEDDREIQETTTFATKKLKFGETSSAKLGTPTKNMQNLTSKEPTELRTNCSDMHELLKTVCVTMEKNQEIMKQMQSACVRARFQVKTLMDILIEYNEFKKENEAILNAESEKEYEAGDNDEQNELCVDREKNTDLTSKRSEPEGYNTEQEDTPSQAGNEQNETGSDNLLSASKEGSHTQTDSVAHEYYENNSKWTLRYRNRADDLVELVHNSGIYVHVRGLRYCHRVCQNCMSLARELLGKIFSDKALRTCCLTHRTDDKLKNKKGKPSLDQHALNVLIEYANDYAQRNGWITLDTHIIMGALDLELRELGEELWNKYYSVSNKSNAKKYIYCPS